MNTPKNSHLRLTALVVGTYCLGMPVIAAPVPDLDGDGIPNIVDPDIDNDGIPNGLDRNVDGGIAISGPYRGQYIGDHLSNDNPAEKDIDGDGLADDSLGERDIDGDGKSDHSPLETDIDGDQRADDSADELDIDGDGRNDDDDDEDDIDGDGFDDDDDEEMDIDGDGVDDDHDDDIDGDSLLNSDAFEDDTDGDGLKDDDDEEDNDDGDSLDDREDDDDDNDGEPDEDDLDHHHEDDEVEVEAVLDRVNAPAGSQGVVKIQRMATGEIEFGVEVEGAANQLPVGSYELVIDGQVRGILSLADEGGELEGEVEYETTPEDADEQLLDFEVIGLPIAIRKGGVVYFDGIVPNPPPSSGGGDGEWSEEIDLIAGVGVSVEAKASAQVKFDEQGAKEFDVEMEELPDGASELLVGGLVRAAFVISGGEAQLNFRRSPEGDELALDFAIAGQPVVIQQGGNVIFSGQLPAGPAGEEPQADILTSALTAAGGLGAGAMAEVNVEFGLAGPVEIEIEAEGVPAGSYVVILGGKSRGTINIVEGSPGIISFKTIPEEAGDLPLDFLVIDPAIELRKDGAIVFSGSLPSKF